MQHPNFDIGPLSRPALTVGGVLILNKPCVSGTCWPRQIIFGQAPGRALAVEISPLPNPAYDVYFCIPHADDTCAQLSSTFTVNDISIVVSFVVLFTETVVSITYAFNGVSSRPNSQPFQSQLMTQPLTLSSFALPLKGKKIDLKKLMKPHL